MTIHDMQNLNRATMEYISSIITPGMTLIEVRDLCERFMLSHGANSFWYWDVGAFVFCGDKTAISVSGREYKTDDAVIVSNDIITIDLSPQHDNIWGDYARTLIIENGKVVTDISSIQNEQWRQGLQMEEYLHEAMRDFVDSNTTFEDLFYFINGEISKKGYVNLDFLGNLGHSIVREKSKRIYIEKGNATKLSDVEAFTFEPHISLPDSVYGFKKENIYSFINGQLVEL